MAKTINLKDRDKVASQIIRAYAALLAAGAVDVYDLNLDSQGALTLMGYYCEGASAAGAGEVTIEIIKGYMIDGEFIASHPTVMNHAIPVAGGPILESRIMPERYPYKPENKNYSVTGAAWAAGVATYTIGSHIIKEGDRVTVRGMNPAGFDVDFAEVTEVTATTFKVAMVTDPTAFVGGGNAFICYSFDIYFENHGDFDRFRIRANETGDTTNYGDLLLAVNAKKLV